jgi:hypothetical protein
MNELDPLALICFAPQTSPNLWNNHKLEGKQKRIDSGRKLKVLYVFIKR